MKEQIIVHVGTDGSTKVEVKGCVGKSCASLTAEIERALGATSKDEKLPEFYQASQQGRKAGR